MISLGRVSIDIYLGPDRPWVVKPPADPDIPAEIVQKIESIRFTEHLKGDGATVFEHVCHMGLEGIVSKRTDAPYRSGPSRAWVKTKNPASDAVRREREEEWR